MGIWKKSKINFFGPFLDLNFLRVRDRGVEYRPYVDPNVSAIPSIPPFLLKAKYNTDTIFTSRQIRVGFRSFMCENNAKCVYAKNNRIHFFYF